MGKHLLNNLYSLNKTRTRDKGIYNTTLSTKDKNLITLFKRKDTCPYERYFVEFTFLFKGGGCPLHCELVSSYSMCGGALSQLKLLLALCK